MINWNELELDLSTEESVLTQHSEDASICHVRPQAVVFPRNEEEIRKIFHFCREHKISVHGWGAGTSRGGQPLGPGLIVNFRRHMNKILHFDPKTGETTVQPGVYYSELQKFLREKGLSFPPDPSYHQCTIGGLVANNAAGIHSVKYGGTIEHLAAVTFITPDGKTHSSDHPDELQEKTKKLLREYWPVIERTYPKVEKNSAGYALNRALTDEYKLDLPKLFAGSEGTLGLLTEIRVRSVPIPQATSLGILYFRDLRGALQTAMDLRRYDIAACELVDKILLDLHAEHTKSGPKHAKQIHQNEFLDLFYSSDSQAILIVELEGINKESARASLEEALRSMSSTERRFANTVREEQRIWDLRRHTSPILNKLENGKISIKPLWAVEDVSLPREHFLEYVEKQEKLFLQFGLTCSFFGHAASCNLHIDPIAIDPRKARENEAVAKLFDEVAAESYKLVIQYGGSISGEHGDGLIRTPYLRLQYPECYPLFAEVKKLFDPQGICNPGKIV